MGVFGVAVQQEESGAWSAGSIQTINISPTFVETANKNFTRPGLGGVHRFGSLSNGNVRGSYIRFSKTDGFSLQNTYEVDINDEISTFDDGGIDPKPFKTHSYDIAYDEAHDRYTVAAVLVERFVGPPFDDGGVVRTQYRFYSGVVQRTFDASLVSDSTDAPLATSAMALTAAIMMAPVAVGAHSSGCSDSSCIACGANTD